MQREERERRREGEGEKDEGRKKGREMQLCVRLTWEGG